MISHLTQAEKFSLYVIEENATVNDIADHLHHHIDIVLAGSQKDPHIALKEILKKNDSLM